MKVDMTRGKPSEEQLNFTSPMQDIPVDNDPIINGVDVRNYGTLDGLESARQLLAPVLQTDVAETIAFGNSSLTLMFLYARWLLDRYSAQTQKRGASFIALTPGYDRHFAICQELGIKLISVPLLETGPDIAAITKILENDSSVIGMWCVPKYSNPTGITYTDQAVKDCAALGKKSNPLFTLFWDNAYGVHDFDASNSDKLLPIMPIAKSIGTQNNLAVFCSTSKITYAGSGLAAIALSDENKKGFLKHLGAMSIGPDKMVQLRHVRFFCGNNSIQKHMQLHAANLKPKFDAVTDCFEKELSDTKGVSWSNPKGGYFISLNLPIGKAKKVREIALTKGVTLTAAGSAFPYGQDPNDCHLRIAPSYPTTEEITYASKVIVEAVKEALD